MGVWFLPRRLENSGREVIDLSFEQIENFAGNALELTGPDGSIFALSQRAYDTLLPNQLNTIEQITTVIPLNVPTIGLAGGSVRCMFAGVHLTQ